MLSEKIKQYLAPLFLIIIICGCGKKSSLIFNQSIVTPVPTVPQTTKHELNVSLNNQIMQFASGSAIKQKLLDLFGPDAISIIDENILSSNFFESKCQIYNTPELKTNTDIKNCLAQITSIKTLPESTIFYQIGLIKTCHQLIEKNSSTLNYFLKQVNLQYSASQPNSLPPISSKDIQTIFQLFIPYETLEKDQFKNILEFLQDNPENNLEQYQTVIQAFCQMPNWNTIKRLYTDDAKDSNGGVTPPQIDDPFFAASSILQQKCINCHSGFHQRWQNFRSSKDWVKNNLVIPGKPNSSLLFKKLKFNGGNMPLGNSAEISNDENEKIKIWIESLK